MLIHRKGNLIDLAEAGEFDVIVHGCNCLNTMGAGIAREIRERYPAAYEKDADYFFYNTTSSHPIDKLGNYTSATTCREFEIINAYTQIGFLPRGIDHFEYESFHLILHKLVTAYPTARVGFPYIGMGLAGGNKELIIAMIENFAVDVTAKGGTVTLVEFG